ncbi:MAG: hypothetical protein P1U65_00300 [Minwuia sp.]|nr:hypothetical protein [Minwuia sp.]
MRVIGVGHSSAPALASAAVPVAERGNANDARVQAVQAAEAGRRADDAERNVLAHKAAPDRDEGTAHHWPAPTLHGLIGHRLLFEVQRQAQGYDLPGNADGRAPLADRASDAVIAYQSARDLSTMVLTPERGGLRQPFRV